MAPVMLQHKDIYERVSVPVRGVDGADKRSQIEPSRFGDFSLLILLL